ncbi:MAG: hypothetical protein ACI906_004507 [Candidatus Latescibacterota bacterium]|jgi:hypothetical protein
MQTPADGVQGLVILFVFSNYHAVFIPWHGVVYLSIQIIVNKIFMR